MGFACALLSRAGRLALSGSGAEAFGHFAVPLGGFLDRVLRGLALRELGDSGADGRGGLFHVGLRGVRRGDHLEAERLAREAVGLAPAEMPNLRADLKVDLAEVLLWAEQPAKSQPVIAEAIELYKRKGNLVSAARARAVGD